MISKRQVFEDLVSHHKEIYSLSHQWYLHLASSRDYIVLASIHFGIIFSWRPCNSLCSSAALKWWLHSRRKFWKVENPIFPTIALIATPQQCILDAKVWVPLLRMFGSELTAGAFYLLLVLLVDWLESLSTKVDLLLSCFAVDLCRFYQLVANAPTTHNDEEGNNLSFQSGVRSCVTCTNWPLEVVLRIVTSCFVCLLHDCFLVSRVFIWGSRVLK